MVVLADIRKSASRLSKLEGLDTDWQLLSTSVDIAADLLSTTTDWLIDAAERDPQSVQAAANSVLEILGVSLGMWCLADAAHAAGLRLQNGEDRAAYRAWLRFASFYALQEFPKATFRQETIEIGSRIVAEMTPDVLGAHIA